MKVKIKKYVLLPIIACVFILIACFAFAACDNNDHNNEPCYYGHQWFCEAVDEHTHVNKCIVCGETSGEENQHEWFSEKEHEWISEKEIESGELSEYDIAFVYCLECGAQLADYVHYWQWKCDDNTTHSAKCSLCGKDGESGAHNFENGLCVVCGYDSSATPELEYRIFSNANDELCAECTGIGRSKATEIVIARRYEGAPVTLIGQRAFEGRTELTSVTIPNGVTSISVYAFSGCSSLSDITIPDSVTSIDSSAFENCSVLESIVIPNSVTSIGSYAFSGCSSLTVVEIPDSVTDIRNYAFDGCPIEDAIIPASAISYISKSNLKNAVITSGDSLEEWTFRDCRSLTSIWIPNSVTSIAIGAFRHCGNLTSITVENENAKYRSVGNCLIETESKTLIRGCETSEIPADGSVTRIGDYAFGGCSGLMSVTIPNGVTSVGFCAFEYCTGLTSITIPSSLTNIEQSVLWGSGSLEEIRYTGDIKGWCSISGLQYLIGIGKSVYIGGKELSGELVIPAGVTKIESHAFDGCSGLTSVTIPNSVTSIGNYAFGGCNSVEEIRYTGDIKGWCSISGLNGLMLDGKSGRKLYIDGKEIKGELVIPDDVTSIDSYAFYGCPIESATIPAIACRSIRNTALKTVVITSGNSVENDAFSGCSSLTSIVIPDSVTSIGNYAFAGCLIESATIPASAIPYISKSNLKAVVITSGESITKGAFAECRNLESITLPFVGIGAGAKTEERLFGAIFGSTSYFGGYLAEQCTVLYETTMLTTPYYIPSSLKSVTVTGGDVPFGAFSNCTSLESITLDGVSGDTIRGYTFYGCTGLSEYVIPDNIAEIEQNAFENCTSLASIDLNKTGVIRSYAFAGCTSLENIVIPQYMWSIGWDIFKGCSNLTSVTFADTEWLYMQNESTGEGEIDLDMSDPAANVTHMTVTYKNKTLVNKWYWDMSTKQQP